MTEKSWLKKAAVFAAIFLGVWLVMRYLFGIVLPFLLGWGLAVLAEPGVRFFRRHLRCRRGLASALAVTLALALLGTLVWLVFALGYRELMRLAHGLPAMAEQAAGMISGLQSWALSWVRRAPAGLAAVLEQAVTDFFTGGSMFLEKVTSGLLSVTGKIVGGLPGGLLTVGTVIFSGYMISAQLPALQKRFAVRAEWQQRAQNLLTQLKKLLSAWLVAQAKLVGVSFLVVLGGFLLLRVEHPFLWALTTAIVDAIPVLGTGTVLIPWAAICLLRGETVRAVGMLSVYLTAMLIRSALEPKLVGRQLGLNPLLTLLAIYAGYRLWGVAGMILAPILAVTANQLAALGNRNLRD